MMTPGSANALLLADAGYQVQRSVRLRSSASAYLNRTPATAGNRKTWTWSAWIKRGTLTSGGGGQSLFYAGNSTSTARGGIVLGNAGTDKLSITGMAYNGTTTVMNLETTAEYRDASAWYHIVVALDTTQATASNRCKMYVNNVQVTAFGTATYPSLNQELQFNDAILHATRHPSGDYYFDGYLTEVNFIDGQALTPSSFGAINPVTGVWSAKKYAGTYGTNGFFLNFNDNSAATAAAIGKDSSGNGNNWTPSGVSVTAGSTYDSMLDVPLGAGGGERGNYCVMNPLKLQSNMRLTNGNLDVSSTDGGSAYCAFSSIVMSSGSWYAEYTINTSTGNFPQAGVGDLVISPTSNQGLGDANGTAYQRDGRVIVSGSTIGTFATFTNGDVVGVAYDSTNNRIYFAKNNTWINSGNPSAGTGYFSPAAPNLGYVFGTATYSAGSCSINFGQRPFAYTPPIGFKALHTGNLPDPVIKQGGKYMNAVTWSGDNATSRAITGLEFQPDFAWIKSRSLAASSYLTNSVVGAEYRLQSNDTRAEAFQSQNGYVSSFNSNGFTVAKGSSTDPTYTGWYETNQSGQTYVAWQWKANGAAVSNTAGSITSQVSAGVSQGFSVVTYTGTGANATVGHGLGVAPKMLIVKNRGGSANDWAVWHTSIGDNFLRLNTTVAQAASTANGIFNTASFTSSVFAIGNSVLANQATTMVAYCFSEVAGYSKFGSYTGNGSADGPFIYTGFRPRFIMVKSATSIQDWKLLDTSRNSYNSTDSLLGANISAAEDTNAVYNFDILSNGFKIRNTFGYANTSGQTYIYMAFAEHPFKNSLAR